MAIIALLPENMREAYARRYFNESRRRVFYNKVAELYSNSVKVDDIMASLLRRAEHKDKNSTDSWLYKSIFQGLAATGSLSEGLKRFVPTIDHILVRAGEQSGDLAKTLRAAADLNEKTSKMKGMIRKALTYPVILFLMLVGITCWFGSDLFPQMEGLLPVSQWPSISQSVYGFSQFMLNYYWLVLILFAAFIVFVWWSMANLTGPLRMRLDKIPPWSLYRLTQGGAWIMSISSMVAAGTINIEALNIVCNESKKNPWLLERTRAVRDNISRSQSMGEAMTTRFDFPDAELCADMGDYARSGNFNEIFEKVGKEWIETGVEKVEAQSKSLNGASIGIAMLCIFVLVFGVLRLMMYFANTTSGLMS